MQDEQSELQKLLERVKQLEVDVISQEHRPTHIFYRLLRMNALYGKDDARRSAAIWALLLGFVFSPSSVAFGGGIAALVTVVLMYQQTETMRKATDLALKQAETNVSVDAKPVEWILDLPQKATFTVVIANTGTEPVFVSDAWASVWIKGGDSWTIEEFKTPRNYLYDCRLLCKSSGIVESKTFVEITYELDWADAFSLAQPDNAFPAKGKLYEPAKTRLAFERPDIAFSDLTAICAIIQPTVLTLDGKKLTCLTLVSFDNGACGVSEDGQTLPCLFGHVWPAKFTRFTETPFKEAVETDLRQIWHEMQSQSSFSNYEPDSPFHDHKMEPYDPSAPVPAAPAAPAPPSSWETSDLTRP